MWPTDIYLKTSLFFSNAFPSPWKSDSDKNSEKVKEVFVVAVVIDSMRWCCSVLSLSLIYSGSNSARMLLHSIFFYEGFFSKKRQWVLLQQFYLLQKFACSRGPSETVFQGKLLPGNYCRYEPRHWEGRHCLHTV